MIEPIDLSPELERQSRVNDILVMRKLDKKLGVIRYEIKQEALIWELNNRFSQYKTQFPFSNEFCIFQTVQDFKLHLFALQAPSKKGALKIKYELPVCSDKSGKMIYANPQWAKGSDMFSDK